MIASQTLLLANTMTEVYRAESFNDNALCAEVFVCNQDSGQWTTLDMVVKHKTQELQDSQFFYRGYSMRPNETTQLKLLLQHGDTIHVRVTTARVSVVVSAEEVVTPQALKTLETRLDDLLEDRIQRREERQADAEAATAIPQRSSTRLVRHMLMENAAVASGGNRISQDVNLEYAERVESLLLRASSVSGTADVKAEYTSAWDNDHFGSFDDTTDITASTLLDRANNTEGWNTFAMSAPLNRWIRIRVTGVAANPADTLVTAYLIVRESYA